MSDEISNSMKTLFHVPATENMQLTNVHALTQIDTSQQALSIPSDHIGLAPHALAPAENGAQLWGYAAYVQMQTLVDEGNKFGKI